MNMEQKKHGVDGNGGPKGNGFRVAVRSKARVSRREATNTDWVLGFTMGWLKSLKNRVMCR